jgi:multicomponent Na+:H+ antiporter subunit C
MTGLTLAIVVGALFASGTYLVLRRAPIRLILGLGLISHGVNLTLFSTSIRKGGLPPIIEDKETFSGAIEQFVDPLPQALILTAIVIGFGVTAFIIALISRRAELMESTHSAAGEIGDPFGTSEHYLGGLDQEPDDYVWLEYSLADGRRQQRLSDSTALSDQQPAADDQL